jgi:hypothetical protein
MPAMTVHRDQAVWERETFEVDVPDGLSSEEIKVFVQEQLDAGNATETREPYVLDQSLDGFDPVVEIEGLEEETESEVEGMPL